MKVLFVSIGVLLLFIAWISSIIFSIRDFISHDSFEDDDE